MSDDLISRKVLLDELSSLRIELNGISCRKEFKNTVNEVLGCVKHIVDDQPTVFDKEKVIEEIRNVPYGYYNVEVENEIVEIVEKGGIE